MFRLKIPVLTRVFLLCFVKIKRPDLALSPDSMTAASPEDASGEDASGEDVSGDDASGEDASGEATSGEDASGEAASGEDASGEDSSGEDASGDGAAVVGASVVVKSTSQPLIPVSIFDALAPDDFFCSIAKHTPSKSFHVKSVTFS